jgi:hypothetical protein
MSTPPAAPHYQPPAPPPQQSGGSACLIWGCVGCAILLLLAAVAIGAMAYYMYSTFHSLTADHPVELPAYELAEGELEAVQERCDEFTSNVESGQPARLQLTGDDLNALLAGSALKDPEMARAINSDTVFFTVEDDQIGVEASIPLDQFPGFSGRYFNGHVRGTVQLQGGSIFVVIESISLGEQIPDDPEVRKAIQQAVNQNLNQNPEIHRHFEKIDRMMVEDGKLILLKE